MNENDPIVNAMLNTMQELLKAELDKLPEYHITTVALAAWARSLTRQALAKGVLPTQELVHEAVTASSAAGVLLY